MQRLKRIQVGVGALCFSESSAGSKQSPDAWLHPDCLPLGQGPHPRPPGGDPVLISKSKGSLDVENEEKDFKRC